MSFVSSKGNILCRLVNIEHYKIFAIINRAIKGLHCTSNCTLSTSARDSLIKKTLPAHFSDVITSVLAYQITGVSIVCSTVCWGAYQRKYQSSPSLAFVRGIDRWPVDSPHKGQERRKCFHLITSSWGKMTQVHCAVLMFLIHNANNCICWFETEVVFEFVLQHGWR